VSRGASIVLGALLLAGCGSGPGDIERENDRLRAQVLDLQGEIERLQGRAGELEAQLRAEAAAPGSVPEDVRANAPTVAAIDIDRLSHAEDGEGAGRPDRLIVYLKPRDGLGRFIQIVGDLSVHAALLPAKGDAVTIGRVTIGPAGIREAYRSSFMGTHYTIEVPLAFPDRVPDDGKAMVMVEFVDGFTGTHLTAEQGIALR
jgi:outer membrane murein-binding lipoprotein Lpp